MKRILRPIPRSFQPSSTSVRGEHATTTVRSRPDSRCSCACSYSGVLTISTNVARLGYCTSSTTSQSSLGSPIRTCSARPLQMTLPPRPSIISTAASPYLRYSCPPVVAPSSALALNLSRFSITTGPSSGACISCTNWSRFGRMELTRSPLLRSFGCRSFEQRRHRRRQYTDGSRGRAALRLTQAVPGVPRQERVERVEEIPPGATTELRREGGLDLPAQHPVEAPEAARDRRRVVDREQRGTADRRDRIEELGPLRHDRADARGEGAFDVRALGQVRIALPLPLRDLGTEVLDVLEVVVDTPGAHTRARRDLGDARAQRALLVAREQRVDDGLPGALAPQHPAVHGGHHTIQQ